jgi:hypothetical protein
MTGLTPERDLPGTRLLQFARLIFDDAVLDAAVRPTLADLQREVDQAGGARRKRRAAMWRGYRAFWTLALISPFAFWGAPVPGRAPIAFPDLAARVAVTIIFVTIGTLNDSALGIWTAVVGVGGTCFAVAIHGWYGRHPLSVAMPAALLSRRPEINMSAIPVGADMGGLLFVVGSMFAVLAGVPMVRWFLVVAVVLGGCVAWALLAWHASHPQRLRPENQLLLR